MKKKEEKNIRFKTLDGDVSIRCSQSYIDGLKSKGNRCSACEKMFLKSYLKSIEKNEE